jgi:hypothetical protein
MKVLLSDGSSLASRQIAGLLAAAGHEVGVLHAGGLSLGRLTGTVRHQHRVPRYGDDPFVWLDAAVEIYRRHHYDVLFPTQEQVAVLTLAPADVATAVPDLAALAEVQDKVSATRTLDRLGVPQPSSRICSPADLPADAGPWPAFLKRPIATGSTGVALVEDAAAAAALAAGWGDDEVVVQQPAAGPLLMAQAVADHGRLVGWAVNRRLAEGVGGGASRKESLHRSDVAALLGWLVEGLGWHGAMSVDLIDHADGPLAIDVNPRLVEPANAAAAGVDLVGALLALALSRSPATLPEPTGGVRTHQGLLALLGAARSPGARRAVVAEAARLATHRGPYAGSREELTPVAGDRRTAIVPLVATAAVLVRPAAWEHFAAGGVAGYALSPDGWGRIRSRLTPPPDSFASA